MDRRRFLLVSALAATAACGGERPARSTGASAVPLTRTDSPGALPLHDDIPPIADGLSPESGGVLKILNYPEYVSPDVLKAFGKPHGVEVELTTFNTMEDAISKLRTPGASFDVWFPTPDVIGKAAVGKLLRPLNKTYLGNLANAWPELQSPFYDEGSRYSVPYCAYTSGVGYRADRVSGGFGYGLLWDPAYKGKAYLIDDHREGPGPGDAQERLPGDQHRGSGEDQAGGDVARRTRPADEHQDRDRGLPARRRGPGDGASLLVGRHDQRAVVSARGGGRGRARLLVPVRRPRRGGDRLPRRARFGVEAGSWRTCS